MEQEQKKLIYLASVYSWPYDETVDAKIMEKRFRLVAKCAAKLYSKGLWVYSPIAHTHPISKYGKIPGASEMWYEASMMMLDRCDELWVMDTEGWNKSVGVKEEINRAKQRGLKMRLVTPRGRDYKFKEVPTEIVF